MQKVTTPKQTLLAVEKTVRYRPQLINCTIGSKMLMYSSLWRRRVRVDFGQICVRSYTRAVSKSNVDTTRTALIKIPKTYWRVRNIDL